MHSVKKKKKKKKKKEEEEEARRRNVCLNFKPEVFCILTRI